MSLNQDDFRPCIIIPCYNHGATLAAVLERLEPLALPCILVDDGSDAATQVPLREAAARHSWVTLLRLPVNRGKGAAVMHGLRAAARTGYSHALQVDADGQHRLEDAPRLLAAARREPGVLISGRPVYDDSIPRARRWGRYITHIWVWIETLSFSLRDSMCGFRVYPLAPTVALLDRVRFGERMDFDTEIMVRLYRDGTPSRFIDTPVVYPADGISHFDALNDNLRISWMHTRLVCGMLMGLPRGLLRRGTEKHWARTEERRGLAGMRFMLWVWQRFGRRAFGWLLRPVAGVYWLTGGNQRRASRLWLSRVETRAAQLGVTLPAGLNSYRHFLRFGDAMLNKIAAWRGEIRIGHEIDFAPGAEAYLNHEPGRGKLILASHLGDIEASRALAQHHAGLTINALVFTEHARRFRQVMEEIAPLAGVNLMPVTDIGPETAMLLQQKLEAGEWVAIVGDRTAVGPQRGGGQRVTWSPFMGHLAPFPQGPFILAAALKSPVVVMTVLREQGRLVIHAEPLSDGQALPRKGRQQALQALTDRYAQWLEQMALRSPLDWFNFYDFWRLPPEQEAEC
jgi:predicted LPLAT superfamily acyltransferase